MTVENIFTPERIDQASAEVERLQHNLDITNADHIALWLEANMGDSSLGYLACRIIEAHEEQMALAALPPPSAGDGWLPIETAPKDGTEIVALDSATGTRHVTWWQYGRWYDPDNHYYSEAPEFAPTHWLVLLPSPAMLSAAPPAGIEG